LVNLENHGKPGEPWETLRTRVTKGNKGRTREEPGENRKTRGIQKNGEKSEIRSSRGNMKNQGKYGNQVEKWRTRITQGTRGI